LNIHHRSVTTQRQLSKLIHADSAPKQKYFPAIPENMKKAGLDGLPFSNTIKNSIQ